MVFGDNIDIVARTPADLDNTFISLQIDAAILGLKINEIKTKYMYTGPQLDVHEPLHFMAEGFTFERVKY